MAEEILDIVVTVSSSDYVYWLCVVSGAVLCVWAELIMLAINRTEAVVNKSRAELHMYKGVDLRSWRGSDVWRDLCLGRVFRMVKGTR